MIGKGSTMVVTRVVTTRTIHLRGEAGSGRAPVKASRMATVSIPATTPGRLQTVKGTILAPGHPVGDVFYQ